MKQPSKWQKEVIRAAAVFAAVAWIPSTSWAQVPTGPIPVITVPGSVESDPPVEASLTTRPCKNIRVTGGKVRPVRTSGSRPDRIDIETLAHVEAENAIRSDVGVDQRR